MSGKTETKVFNEKDPKPEEDSLPINPEENANIFSHIVFWWLNSLMFKGYKRPLEKEDLYDLGETYSSHNLSVRFGNAWKGEFQRPKASLFHALHVTFGRRFWSAGFLKFLGDMAQTVSPLFVRAITNYVSESARNNEVHGLGYGFGLAVGLLLIQIFGTLCTHAYFHITMTTGFAIRSALITNIYKKSMVLSGKARQSFSAGKVTNIMSTDTSRIDMTCGYLQMLWLSPLQLVVALGLLIDTLGPSALAGFAVLVLFGPLQGTIMRKLAIFRRRAAAVTDQRVKITQEVLQGVKVIKFFAWEESFSQKLAELRNQELSNVQKLLVIRALIFSTALVIPVFASILSFVVYYLTDHDLNPGVVFASVALFNVLRLPLMLFPAIIGFTVDAKVSLGRIQELLLAPELDTLPPIEQSADFGIRVENGKFMWEAPPPEEEDAKMKKKRIKEEKKNKKMMKSKTVKNEVKQADNNEEAVTVENSTVEGSKSSEPQEETMPFLRDINITIPKGKLVAVVGSVGSGKSSLLNALVGEMRLVDGSITFGGRVGYCPQTAWIQNATLKENIIFGLPFDEERYKRVLNVCALERDLEVLPGGDHTEIGERGINLSGGQKQRLNIARAVYFDSDIVLLDDPLSAVDAHVGRHLFDKCIVGELSGKTRLLVTHQLHYIRHCDYVLYLNEGRITEQGTYQELMNSNSSFAKLLHEYGGIEEESVEEDNDKSSSNTITDENPQLSTEAEVLPKAAAVTSSSIAPGRTPGLMTTEERSTGAVNGKIYMVYFSAGGGLVGLTMIMALLILTQVTRVGNDLWLSYWSEQKWGLTKEIYMGVYVAWGVGQSIFMLLFGVSVAISGIMSARTLHNNAIDKVFRAPMSFFDTTPLGRIINRFSKDIDSIDNLLADSFRMFSNTLATTIATFILISVIFPLFLIPLVPLLVIYYFVQLFYRATSREVKRLDSISRSPLYAHFSETLNGLATIRAYRVQDRFIHTNEHFMNGNNRPYYLSISIQRWLGVRLENISNLLTFFATVFAVLARNKVAPGQVGLVLSYSLQVTGVFNWCVRQAAEVETNMNAVERVDHYIHNIESEADLVIGDKRPEAEWPQKGDIEIQDLELAYREGLPPVLHGINLSIRGGEKIGVVGRTGAGKSSIMVALFRVVEASRGSIAIDGVDISTIGLHDLRSKLAIIPQDPVLFTGTVRSNLDPFNYHTDQELWDVLGRADLKTYFSALPGGLESDIAEGGENLSAGQRQLLCLARAMLTRSKIVIMDEATASVDVQTDALLQKALRIDFAECTVLTIAHRLNTVIDYDKILVLDAGRVKEFDSPKNLLSDVNSSFYSMVQETGPTNAALLMSLAK